ncbi:uncharacterized protein LOC657499 [Tribolium castaneum]|uniref:THAP-type domain-containing protein n=1 Tax=Tribolium castaneum TaxID=7070 RepID=D2A5W3_TRICA|nr:PREDICTED: uncharacterized protein LOC657499 [Tribolium castaneum]XP_976249.1 PREDICTED: uncharacterized protein LOC657499 [Tribolium castaneum]EFA05428.1 hypothetical protein TcasGA2_TC015604 [Tribolium castaneum]|eukprot:XP_008194725.1 PREDICTED: uncharacterized protein LOC657499 [Tribolium castaneum]
MDLIDSDEEPLLEVTRVTVLTDNKVHTNEVRTREVRKEPSPKYKKFCYVPLCPNASHTTPEKMFIMVPVNPVRRKKWLQAVGRPNTKNPKSPMFCCEDHFNLREDMRNFGDHVKNGKIQMLLHPTVVPHTFICNDYGHLKRAERIKVLRRLHKERNAKLEDEETEVLHITRPTARQLVIQEAKKRKTEVGKTVFIEVPAFELSDQSDYFVVKEDGVDTIVIEDSDMED